MGVPYTGQMLTGRYADNKKSSAEALLFLCIVQAGISQR